MQDFRCQHCRRLLAKVDGDAIVEIKCPRCKGMNVYNKEIFITIEERDGKEACTDPDVVGS